MSPDQVFSHYGGKAMTARRLNISYQAVREWETKGRVPEVRQYQIEVMTGGQLKARRPDFAPPAPTPTT